MYIFRSNMQSQPNLPRPNKPSSTDNRVIRSRYFGVKTMPHTQARENRAFKFLELPVAARELVYQYAILEEQDAKFRYLNESAEINNRIWLYWRDKTPNASPAISKVCGQMSQEALHIYYAIPRIYYPYIKQMDLPALRALQDSPTSSSQLAPNGVAELAEFSMCWSVGLSYFSNGVTILDEYIVKASATIHDFPSANILLESSPKSAETYWDDNFMNNLLNSVHAGVECCRRPVERKGSGRRWTAAEFDTSDVLRALQAIHYQLLKADGGPTYTGIGIM
ncbi:hypothetical protein BDV97DRAFT_365695 [Delphinella strobiligena]|nr:hypothetical protein BDV97DRAFT_365695 [Delphinella strobiligena]